MAWPVLSAAAQARAAATPGAEGLTLPVTTVYDPSIKGRQRAKAFKVEEQLVPLFRISLMQTQD